MRFFTFASKPGKPMIQSRLLICSSLILLLSLSGCGSGAPKEQNGDTGDSSSLVKRHREDGTLSSVNPVDEDGYVHGVKVNYYDDGKSVHSKITYEHGRKHGPALWYYRNGQVHEHTAFHYGRKHGPTRKYYENGSLMEELTYEQGEVQPGKKVYNRSGDQIEP
jgi:antitoxin component YwqK of YwqJK toxin-antitoxin module